jgi:hypothetical protein
MVIKQRSTRFDDFLLKVAFPMLHGLGIGRFLPSIGIWHRSQSHRPSSVRVVSRPERPVPVMSEAKPYISLDRRKAA